MIHGGLKHKHASPSPPVLLAGCSERDTGRACLKTAAENGLDPRNVKSTGGNLVTKEQEEQGSCARGESASKVLRFSNP